MKKLLVLFVCLFTFTAVSFADNDRPISFNQLPEKAKIFIRNHFHVSDVQKAFIDGDEYEVRLRGGVKIEFGKAGRWKEVESKRKAIPNSIIPERILHKVRKEYGHQVRVVEISRDHDEIEVKLSNGQEIEFDRDHRKVEDDD